MPKIFNLRTDPYERADITSNTYYDWLIEHAYLLVPAQQIVGQFLATFKEFPPRQKAASFSIDQVMEKLTGAGARRGMRTRKGIEAKETSYGQYLDRDFDTERITSPG